MGIKVGEEVELQADKRYIQHSRDHSIGDVYDALVELITNADDSYNRLFRRNKRSKDGGDILIEHREQRGGQRSYIVVRDKAEGMDSEDMQRSLLRMGAYRSEAGNRGYMGRGAKDCTALGDLTFESIKNERYYRCKITHDLKFVLEESGSNATREHRQKLGLERGNGTSVTLELNVPLPRLEKLAANLPWHFSLRDIMSETSDSRVQLRRADVNGAKAERLVYRPPEGELVVDESFPVERYANAKARLRIWRAPEPLEESKAGARFGRFGILVKGERAIHELTLLAEEFKRDPHASHYFGRLDCVYLDQLMAEYEECRSNGQPHTEDNPSLIVDPHRRFGLDRRHPFVQALIQVPSERLRALIAKDREREKSQRREVANQETRSRLSRLAKLAGRFLSQQLDELEELSGGDAVDDAFAKQGVFIYPTYLNVGVDKERTLTFYAKRSLLKNENETVTIEADSENALEIYGATFNLHSHHSKDDRLVGTFKVKGLQASESVVLTAKVNGLPTAEALVQVVDNTTEERIFDSPLEFERTEYSVKQGSQKSLRLFAKYPEVVAEETKVKFYTDDNRVAVRGHCILTPVAGTNYAEGTVTVEGRTLKSKTTIIAEVNGRRATTLVKVVDKPKQDRTVPIEFEIRDEDYGNFRARWADHEGKPHLLLISAKHKSLARYLGPENENFPGQDTPLFRVLIAEIVAESVCRKALTMEAKERPFDFPWADLKEADLIADDVLAKMQQRLRQFVADAHSIMLSDLEIKAA